MSERDVMLKELDEFFRRAESVILEHGVGDDFRRELENGWVIEKSSTTGFESTYCVISTQFPDWQYDKRVVGLAHRASFAVARYCLLPTFGFSAFEVLDWYQPGEIKRCRLGAYDVDKHPNTMRGVNAYRPESGACYRARSTGDISEFVGEESVEFDGQIFFQAKFRGGLLLV